MAEKSFASYNDEHIFGKTLLKSGNNLTVIGFRMSKVLVIPFNNFLLQMNPYCHVNYSFSF